MGCAVFWGWGAARSAPCPPPRYFFAVLTILTLLGLLNGLVLLPVLLSVIGPPPEVGGPHLFSSPSLPHPLPSPSTLPSPKPTPHAPCPHPSLFAITRALPPLLCPVPNYPIPICPPSQFHPISLCLLHPTNPLPHPSVTPRSLPPPSTPHPCVSPPTVPSPPRHPPWTTAPACPLRSRCPRASAPGGCTSAVPQPGPPPSPTPRTRRATGMAWGRAAPGDPSSCPPPRHTSCWRPARTPASPASP